MKRTSEQDSDMAQILELSDWELEITMLDMLRALMGKVGNMS